MVLLADLDEIVSILLQLLVGDFDGLLIEEHYQGISFS